jgi:hypothetical protein
MYNKHDHTHCPPINSPCGIKGSHRCCLCLEPSPQPEEWSVRFDKQFKELSVVSGVGEQGNLHGYDATPYVKEFIKSEIRKAEEKSDEKWREKIKNML